jgi:predicted nucleic acid-binding protein
MKIVIDTNTYFSSLLKKEPTIGEILLGIEENIKFYAPHFLLEEIVKHKNKIYKISGLEEAEISELQFYLNSKINFINEQLIESKNWMKA